MTDDELKIELTKLSEEFVSAYEEFHEKKLIKNKRNKKFCELMEALNVFSDKKTDILSFKWYLDREITGVLSGHLKEFARSEGDLELEEEWPDDLKIKKFKKEFYELATKRAEALHLNWIEDKKDER